MPCGRGAKTLAQVAAVLAAEGMMAGTGRPFAPAQIARLLTAEDKRMQRLLLRLRHRLSASADMGSMSSP